MSHDIVERGTNYRGQLEDVDLGYINEDEGLLDEDLELLAEKISPNVEKLNLSPQDVKDDNIKILLRR